MLYYEIIIGPMFSGKSTELLRRANRYSSIGKNILIVNHTNDTRTDGISTHDGKKMSATKLDDLGLLNLKKMENWDNIDVICIDEAQFFYNLYDFIISIEQEDKIVIVAGLDGTSDRKPFGDGNIINTIPLCDKIDKLNALCMVCKDGTPAIFSKRINGNNDEICIGASDKYIAVSRKGFFCD